METKFCKSIPISDQAVIGDYLVIYYFGDSGTTIAHAAVYEKEGLVISKLSPHKGSPYRSAEENKILSNFGIFEQCWANSSAKGCTRTYSAVRYRCDNGALRTYLNDIKTEFGFFSEITALEHSFNEFFFSGKTPNLSEVEMVLSKLRKKMPSYSKKIGNFDSYLPYELYQLGRKTKNENQKRQLFLASIVHGLKMQLYTIKRSIAER